MNIRDYINEVWKVGELNPQKVFVQYRDIMKPHEPVMGRKYTITHSDSTDVRRCRNFMKTIAIIDDDEYIGNMMEEILRKEGYDVLRAYAGTEALLLLSQHSPDLVLLDLMLPGLSGEEVLSKITKIPVIVISAKVDVQDKVKLLLGGATDYITKPFNTKELLARIIVQLRNTRTDDKKIITVGDLEIDTFSQELRVQGVPVRVTKTEYAIIKLLMRNPAQVISKSIILDRISLDTPDCIESSLKVHISNLRKKLRSVSNKEYIEVVWGIGFKLSEA